MPSRWLSNALASAKLRQVFGLCKFFEKNFRKKIALFLHFAINQRVASENIFALFELIVGYLPENGLFGGNSCLLIAGNLQLGFELLKSASAIIAQVQGLT